MKIKQKLFFLFEIAQIAIIALVIVLPIRYFVFQPFVVKGISMEPNFHNGDYIIVDELSYRIRDPRRGEVVVFHYPKNPSQRFIKRIIGLPYETIVIANDKILIKTKNGENIVLNEYAYLKDSNVRINEKIVLTKDQYFVLGDNRQHSYDSRKWGAVNRKKIIGKAFIRAWPILSAQAISTPSY